MNQEPRGFFSWKIKKLRNSPRLTAPASNWVGFWCSESSLSDDRFFNFIGASTKAPVMGEPEPLDLELLQHRDSNEIRRAVSELELFSYAQAVVYNIMGSRYPADIGEVANESLQKLFERAIHKCNDIAAIRPMLAKIAERRAINFVNVAFRKWERQFGEELQGLQETAGSPDVNPFAVLGDILAEGLGMEAFQLAPVVNRLVEGAELTAIEQHLLKERIMEKCKHREFFKRHGIPVGSIPGMEIRLMMKIRRYLGGEFVGDVRAELLQILRRNR